MGGWGVCQGETIVTPISLFCMWCGIKEEGSLGRAVVA